MTPLQFKSAIRQLGGKSPVFGTMIREMRSPAVGQIMAAAGLDFIIIDLEHSTYGIETTADLIRQARASELCAIVRVPDIQKAWISRVLDAGAHGILVPLVETVEQVEQIVVLSKYPPMGRRGLASQIGQTDYTSGDLGKLVREKNDQTIVAIQIESPLGVRNLPEMLSIQGIDLVISGPNDMAATMNLPGQINDTAVLDQIDRMIDICLSRNVPCGIHSGDQELLRRCMARGCRLIAYGTDVSLLMSAVGQASSTFKEHS